MFPCIAPHKFYALELSGFIPYFMDSGRAGTQTGDINGKDHEIQGGKGVWRKILFFCILRWWLMWQ